MTLAKWISLIVAILAFAAAPGCTNSEPGKLTTPATVFDPTVPDPRTDEMKIADFIVQLERKYKREEIRNTVDLHFKSGGPGRIQVRLTYDRASDPTIANSIADSAVELAKRLKHEDPAIRDVDIAFDREVVRRGD
jgi:hypothetical protein